MASANPEEGKHEEGDVKKAKMCIPGGFMAIQTTQCTHSTLGKGKYEFLDVKNLR